MYRLFKTTFWTVTALLDYAVITLLFCLLLFITPETFSQSVLLFQPRIEQEADSVSPGDQQVLYSSIRQIHEPPGAAPFTETPGSIPAIGAEQLTFGSFKVLQTLWTNTELLGNPADKKIRRLSAVESSRLRSLDYPTKDDAWPVAVAPRKSIRRVIPADGRKIVALTFDLCEKANEIAGYDADIVNYLRSNQIKATFFAGGKWLLTHPDKAMQLIADPLFEIGNHAWTHGNFAVINTEDMVKQITWTQYQYQRLRNLIVEEYMKTGLETLELEKIPLLPTAFRFPYGRCHTEALAVVNRHGLAAIQWDIVSADAARKQTAANIIRTVIHETKPGSIVIFHANGRGYNTSAALPSVINGLKNLGYQFVTVSELLRSGTVVAADSCYEQAPGDNAKYDRIFGRGTGE